MPPTLARSLMEPDFVETAWRSRWAMAAREDVVAGAAAGEQSPVSLATRLSHPENKKEHLVNRVPQYYYYRRSPYRGGRSPPRRRSRSGGRGGRSRSRWTILANMIHSNFFYPPRSPRRSRRSPSYRSVSRGRDRSKSRSPPPKKRSRWHIVSVIHRSTGIRDLREISQQLIVGLLLQETLAASPDQDLVPALNRWQLDLQLEILYFITWGFVLTVTWKIMVIIVQQLRAPSLSIWSFIFIE